MRTFVCNIVPDELVVKLKAPQAPNNFCNPLIQGGAFDKVYSLLPTSYYSSKIKNTADVKYYSGKENYNKLIKLFLLFIYNIKCAWEQRNSESIWFYNICNANALCYVLLRFILRCKTFVILLDHTPDKNKFSLNYYLPFLYGKSRGVISLSMRTNICNHNIAYKAGVCNGNGSSVTVDCNRKPVFLFSGAIANHTGFPLVFETFKDLPDVELYISGNGDVSSYDIDQYPNIHYMGYMEYSEYLCLYDKVDVCLSLRNPHYPENLNNFPSRIIEYFNYNKIVVSTIKYPELSDFKYISISYSKEALDVVVKKLTEMTLDEKIKLMDNKVALYNNFSVESWVKTFKEIEHVAS